MIYRFKDVEYYTIESDFHTFATVSMFDRGWGNGYVNVTKHHPWYGKHYDDVDVNIHGGLTYANKDKEEDKWVFGFDTAHYSDNLQRWSEENVLNETRYLAYQVHTKQYIHSIDFDDIIQEMIREERKLKREEKLKRILK